MISSQYTFDLKTGNIIPKNTIQNAVSKAQSIFGYVRFNLNGTKDRYIMVNFNRDLSVNVSTSSRNLIFKHELEILHRTYTKARLVDLLFRWVNKLNRTNRSNY